MTRTSVTLPNWPKYSLSFSGVVCQLKPPTKSLPGELSEEGVDLPDEEPFWLPLESLPPFPPPALPLVAELAPAPPPPPEVGLLLLTPSIFNL
jgi:hypothetical protein